MSYGSSQRATCRYREQTPTRFRHIGCVNLSIEKVRHWEQDSRDFKLMITVLTPTPHIHGSTQTIPDPRRNIGGQPCQESALLLSVGLIKNVILYSPHRCPGTRRLLLPDGSRRATKSNGNASNPSLSCQCLSHSRFSQNLKRSPSNKLSSSKTKERLDNHCASGTSDPLHSLA